MKIAISAQGNTFESPIDPRFGRAKQFIVFENEGENIHTIDNSINLNAMQGAGIQTAQRMANEGVQVIITGHIGPKAFTVLQKAGIKIVTGAFGTCRESYLAYKEGRLHATSGPTNEGHSF